MYPLTKRLTDGIFNLLNRYIKHIKEIPTTPRPKVTLDNIALHAGVSVAAVSQVLSGKGRISEATRARVLQVVEELSYKPDRVAQSLARRRADRIAEDGAPRPRRRKGRPMVVSAILNLMSQDELRGLVEMELRQMEDEGFDVAPFQAAFEVEGNASGRAARLQELYLDLLSAEPKPDFPYIEPLSLGAILASRPPGPRAAAVALTAANLLDRHMGGWQGRVVGCVLGKPVEAGWSKSQLARYLSLAGALPLDNYIPRVIRPPEGLEPNPGGPGAYRDEIDGAPLDDDTDYTVLATHILEEHGLSFTTSDVATEWLGHLAYFNTYTAERAAYRNLTLNVLPQEAALLCNPDREFIGARIRADVYGMVCPGLPQRAAELAYRDAALSHTRNGIYAAMFTAAMLSWCYVTTDLAEIIRVGLSEIPAKCRLAEAIRDVTTLVEETDDWEIAYDRLILKLGGYHPVHAINNTAWMVLALLHAARRANAASDYLFDSAVTIAVRCGFDTDCNAANAGAIIGLIHGAKAVSAKWTEPLHDTLRTAVAGCPELRISEAANRTARLAERTLFTR